MDEEHSGIHPVSCFQCCHQKSKGSLNQVSPLLDWYRQMQMPLGYWHHFWKTRVSDGPPCSSKLPGSRSHSSCKMVRCIQTWRQAHHGESLYILLGGKRLFKGLDLQPVADPHHMCISAIHKVLIHILNLAEILITSFEWTAIYKMLLSERCKLLFYNEMQNRAP